MGLLFGDGKFNTVEYSEFAFVTRAWVFTDINTAIWLVGIAVVGASALLFLLGAYRIADPAVISPYEYTLLPWMILWGYIFWRDVPSLYDLIGMFLIVGAGLYIYYREQIRNQELSIDTTLR